MLVVLAISALSAAGLGAPSAVAAADSSAGANAAQTLTVYAVPTKKAFVNNHDDRARGKGKNPFGNYAGSAAPTPTNEKLFGPSPGDEGLFSFNLFTNADRKTRTGSALVVCQYDFNENAYCDASFQLGGGSLVGKGAFNYNARTFSLAIIGGTTKYRGMTGHLEVKALGAATQAQPVHRAVPMLQAQRLTFVIQPA